ncbi:MAG: hypothetical protein LBP22_10010 [Deltaproteobacteria bacterium]|jgi:hypothetical protein|nr:hypothetical protein [Deltaproteobacteria bacterium]
MLRSVIKSFFFSLILAVILMGSQTSLTLAALEPNRTAPVQSQQQNPVPLPNLNQPPAAVPNPQIVPAPKAEVQPPPQEPQTAQINPVDDADINALYTGQVNSNGKAEGRGLAKGRDSYVGDFKNGKKSGYGVYIDQRSGLRYEGQFADDLANGQGMSLFPSGWLYEGGFKDGQFSGQGTLRLRNIFNYTGTFLNNNFDGAGIFEQYGVIKIIGHFKSGKLNGFCTVTVPDGSGYQADFVNGQPHGQALFFNYQGQENYTTVFDNGKETGPRQTIANSSRRNT